MPQLKIDHQRAQKRAELLREWILATIGNDGCYYYSTITTGIPDGDEIETVVEDIVNGEYDDHLYEMLDMYHRARSLYSRSGWFIWQRDLVLYDPDEALRVWERCAGFKLPTEIRKGEWRVENE